MGGNKNNLRLSQILQRLYIKKRVYREVLETEGSKNRDSRNVIPQCPTPLRYKWASETREN